MRMRIATVAAVAVMGAAASGLGQPAAEERRALPGGWTLSRPNCAIERPAGAADPTTIRLEATYPFLPDIHTQLFLLSEDWPVAAGQDSYRIDFGFDGGAPAIRDVALPESSWVGYVAVPLTPELRAGMRTAHSLDVWLHGQQVGRVGLAGMTEALAAFEACAASEAEAYQRDQAASENMQGPEGNLMELNLADPAPQ